MGRINRRLLLVVIMVVFGAAFAAVSVAGALIDGLFAPGTIAYAAAMVLSAVLIGMSCFLAVLACVLD